MKVEVVCVVAVDASAQVGGVLVGCASVYGVGTCECSVGPLVGGCACEDIDFEWASCLVFFYCFLSKGVGDYFGRAGCGEAGQTDVVIVVY